MYETEHVAKEIMVDVPRTVMEEVKVPRTVYDTVQKTIQEQIPKVTYERVARESVWNPVSGYKPLGPSLPAGPAPAGAPLPGSALL